MILPIESRLTKKSVKSSIFRRNIENFQYFDEISRVYLTRACAGISRKILVNIGDISVNIEDISVNIGDILVKYHRCIGKILEISEIYRQYFENIDRAYL